MVRETMCVLAGMALLSSAASAAVMIQAEGSGSLRDNLNGTVGMVFTVAGDDDLTVSALGMYDDDLDGLAVAHQVGLWDSAGTLLGSVSIAAGTGADLVGSWRYVDLSTDVTLTAGATYTLGAQVFENSGDFWRNEGGSPTYAPEITNVLSRWTNTGTNFFSRPTNQGGSNGYIAPNLEFTVVPEPASLSLLGFAGLLGLRRHRSA